MDTGNYLEDVGTAVNQLGLSKQRFQSPLAVGAESLLGGFAAGRGFKRARALRDEQKQFESKIGMSYELFSKLSSGAQTEILKHTGVVSDPMDTPLPDYGGRTFNQLEYQGAPERTATAEGTGAFAGTTGEVGVAPGFGPLKAMGQAGATRAMDRYQGVEPPVDEGKQSLIDYRKGRLEQFKADAGRHERETNARIGLMSDQRKALKALTANRTRPDRPVEPWEAEVARSMGVPVPKGVTPTRTQFDRLMKFNRPAGAVITSIDRLSMLARQAEITKRRNLTDKEIDAVVQRETAQLPALAGPNAIGLVLQGVRHQLETLRSQPDVWNTPAAAAEDGQKSDPEAEQDPPDQLDEEDQGDDSSLR